MALNAGYQAITKMNYYIDNKRLIFKEIKRLLPSKVIENKFCLLYW